MKTAELEALQAQIDAVAASVGVETETDTGGTFITASVEPETVTSAFTPQTVVA